MSSLLRPWKVYYVGPDGARCKKTDPGARKVKERVKVWHGQYRDGTGKWVRVPLSENRRAAETLLAERVRRADLERGGMPAPDDAARTAPWQTLTDEYLTHVRAGGVEGRALAEVSRPLRQVFEGVGARCLADLTPAALDRYFVDLAGRRSRRTHNATLYQCQRFGRWLATRKGLTRDPFEGRKILDERIGRVRVRGVFPEDVLSRLLDHVRQCPRERRKLDGVSRYWLYLTAVQTGYRAGELSHVEASGLADGGVGLASDYTKNGARGWQPLPPATYDGLRAWAASRPPGPLWPGHWSAKAAEMIVRDLTGAGLPGFDARGGTLDFHALRHTYVTRIGRAGVGVKEVQSLARHASPHLTLGTYSHTDAARLLDAVARAFPESTRVAHDRPPLVDLGRLPYMLPDTGCVERNCIQEDGF